MPDKLKKNGVKYLVFAINVLLAATAVLIIREKDQARLLEKAQKENVGSESVAGSQFPSFKSSISAEESENNKDIPTDDPLVESEAVVPVSPTTQEIIPANPALVPVPTLPDTAPVLKKKPSNAKTKTS